MALQDVINESRKPDVQDKCRLTFVDAAVNVMSEDAGTVNHAERVVFAGKILYGTIPPVCLTLAILRNTTIQGKIATETNYDDDLAFVAGEVFNAFALSA